MFRSAVIRASRSLSTAAAGARLSAPIVSRPLIRTCACPAPPRVLASAMAVRYYSSPSSLTKSEVEGRIFDLLKGFNKVASGTEVAANSHFTKDLGLDSLDTVEVVMAIEEEFSIEIPDKDAEAIHSVDQAVAYILSQPDAH